MADKEYKPSVPPISEDIEELKRWIAQQLALISEDSRDKNDRLKAGGL